MTEPHPESRPELRPQGGADSAPIPLPVARRTAPVPAASASPPAPIGQQAGFALSLEMPQALATQQAGVPARGVPVLGGLAAIFGVAALFKAPLVLAPLGFLFAVGALLRGQAGWAAIGSISGAVALAISPLFWAVLGLAWLGSWLLG